MKNITNTFITIADDSDAHMGKVPLQKGEDRTLARLHYDLLTQHPYEYDMDSFNFEVFCIRNQIDEADRDSHREAFFSKGHPCMRASPLTKTHGFGAHYNGAGKIAIYPVDSVAYRKLLSEPGMNVEMAMRSKRAAASSAKPANTNPGRGPHRPQSAA